ncbi:MAG: MFS transporter, partial [Comamonadaceae bacterium]
LVQNSVSYENVAGPAGSAAVVKIGDKLVTAPSGNVVNLKFDEASVKNIAAFKKEVATDLTTAGYPAKADPAKMNKVLIVGILFYLVLLVTMVYGPIAAMLVEMFPTRIRYTSMSLPYHIGNGWFGGLLPTMSFAIVAQTGNMYNGLWYPIIIAGATAIIGTLFIRETKDVDIYADD